MDLLSLLTGIIGGGAQGAIKGQQARPIGQQIAGAAVPRSYEPAIQGQQMPGRISQQLAGASVPQLQAPVPVGQQLAQQMTAPQGMQVPHPQGLAQIPQQRTQTLQQGLSHPDFLQALSSLFGGNR